MLPGIAIFLRFVERVGLLSLKLEGEVESI